MSNEKDLMIDLWNIGLTKPMGYLPLRSIESSGFNPDNVCLALTEAGLIATIIPMEICHVFSGALFSCDPISLGKLLQINKDWLKWPTDPALFMNKVASETVHKEKNPKLYQLIGEAFNDHRFPTPKIVFEARVRGLALGPK